METGEALEIVLNMAKSLYKDHGEIVSPAKNPHETQEALDMVEDFIVNHFGED